MKRKVCLVSGGAGFLGSALVRELVRQKAEVIVFDNFVAGTPYNVPEGITTVIGDILSWSFARAVKLYTPEIIFHLAAEPFIPYAYNNPERFMQTNVIGTMNVLMAGQIFDVPKIINYSSSEVYGSMIPELGPSMPELHPTLPRSTYAVSKLAADRLAHVMAKEQGVPVVNVRPFNCYGPRETQPYVIPEIIRQLDKGNEVRLGNLDARRDFTYCDDHAKAVVALAEKGVIGETYNIGTGRSWSVRELVSMIADILEVQPVIKVDESRKRPYDVDELRCDSTKLRKLTSWKPTTTMKDGLRLTVEHFLARGKWSYER